VEDLEDQSVRTWWIRRWTLKYRDSNDEHRGRKQRLWRTDCLPAVKWITTTLVGSYSCHRRVPVNLVHRVHTHIAGRDGWEPSSSATLSAGCHGIQNRNVWKRLSLHPIWPAPDTRQIHSIERRDAHQSTHNVCGATATLKGLQGRFWSCYFSVIH
jgi:hypothetical protein